MTAELIEPILMPLPSSIVDTTLTVGDDWVVTVFVKANVTTQVVPELVPPDAAVSTSFPKLCVHAPTIPRRLDVDVTVNLAVFNVCEPVSPVIVTVDPVARLKLAANVTVNVLVTPETGVLC